MLQRLGLAQALMHEPELIFLDEPTSGLDPIGRRMVRDVIRAQRDRGATVFLNSHLLSEIEVTCDRVAFIRDGEIVESRDLHQDQSTAGRRVRITARQVMPSVVNQLAQWSRAIELSENGLLVDVATDEAIPAIVRHLVGVGVDVSQVVTESTSLEDVFLRLVGEDRGL
jgi:ABC-2 type transport system ATP-binding protein